RACRGAQRCRAPRARRTHAGAAGRRRGARGARHPAARAARARARRRHGRLQSHLGSGVGRRPAEPAMRAAGSHERSGAPVPGRPNDHAARGTARAAASCLLAVACLVLALALGACAADPFRTPETAAWRSPVELEDTPFFPQEKYQCGPAALATVLASSGVDVRPEVLTPRVYVPERGGSLQPEMLAASRDFGRLPYVIEPNLPSLLAEVAAGRPVLVLQNLGVRFAPAWHYAVVVGFSPETGEIVLRSGTQRR